MAYTANQNSVQLATALVSSGVATNGSVLQDQANNAVAALGHQPTNTIAVLWGVLCKVTTNWNNAGASGAQFSYDAAPS
jgi:hypothetical protein